MIINKGEICISWRKPEHTWWCTFWNASKEMNDKLPFKLHSDFRMVISIYLLSQWKSGSKENKTKLAKYTNLHWWEIGSLTEEICLRQLNRGLALSERQSSWTVSSLLNYNFLLSKRYKKEVFYFKGKAARLVFLNSEKIRVGLFDKN